MSTLKEKIKEKLVKRAEQPPIPIEAHLTSPMGAYIGHSTGRDPLKAAVRTNIGAGVGAAPGVGWTMHRAVRGKSIGRGLLATGAGMVGGGILGALSTPKIKKQAQIDPRMALAALGGGAAGTALPGTQDKPAGLALGALGGLGGYKGAQLLLQRYTALASRYLGPAIGVGGALLGGKLASMAANKRAE